MTGNNSKDSSINSQRSDSAIRHVCFCFKRVGRTNKENVPLGNGVKAQISMFL
jgi:hypothetical protein